MGAPQILDSNIVRGASGTGAAGSHQECPSLLHQEWDAITPVNHEIAEIQSGRVFEVHDRDNDGFLNQIEYRIAMMSLGVKNSNDEWMRNYIRACRRTGCSPARGLHCRAFQTGMCERKFCLGLYDEGIE